MPHTQNSGQAPEVLATLRTQDPIAAQQLTAELFSDAANLPAKNSSAPQPGHINHVTDTVLLASKPDLSNSVTLLELGAAKVDLRGMNLQGAQLLIRPKFEPNDFAMPGLYWGVDLTGTDLENTHIELDLSTGLKEKIDSGAMLTGNLARRLLQNLDSHAPAGPGGGGVVGMIKSIPARYPNLRVSLTQQLLDFLNQHPSQDADDKVQGWPGITLAVLALVDQFPELRENPKIADAARRLASGILPRTGLPTILQEIKDPARPSPSVVRCGLDLCLAVSPEARKQFFIDKSELINILLDHAQRVDDSHPDATQIKQLAVELELAYLKTEPFASLSKPFSDYGGEVRVLIHHDKKLSQYSALVFLSDQFQTMLLNPREVQWDLLSASRFRPDDPLPPPLIEAKSLRTDLPSFVALFPTVKTAYAAPSMNAASRAVSKLFEEAPEVQAMMTAFLDRGVRASALGPEEISDVFSRALEPLYEDFKPIYDLKRWPEAQLKPDHLQQLLALAKKEGLGNNKVAFARYLFALSASLLRMSSYKGYGSDDVSVTSLRFYAHSLLREAGRLAPELPVEESDDYATVQKFEEKVRSNACAEDVSGKMIVGAKRQMVHSSYRVLPNHLTGWGINYEIVNHPDENANLPDEAVYPSGREATV